MLVALAWAQQGGQAAPGGGFMSFLPLILIFVIFYFLLIRPQQKRAKEHKAMIEALKKGDKVITSGGIYGLIEAVGMNTVTLKVGENTRVKFGKQYIIAMQPEGGDE